MSQADTTRNDVVGDNMVPIGTSEDLGNNTYKTPNGTVYGPGLKIPSLSNNWYLECLLCVDQEEKKKVLMSCLRRHMQTGVHTTLVDG